MSTVQTVLVFADMGRRGVGEALTTVTERLERVAEVRRVDLSRPDAVGPVAELPGDLGVVLGGDGTILSIARAHGRQQRPLLGINLGKLGYLAEFGMDDIDFIAENIRTDSVDISRRMMLNVKLSDGRSSYFSCAINDVVVHAGPPYRMIDLVLTIDGDQVSEIKGDGLIVSTPTGSTGHNIAAGGPVVDSASAAIVITPICPHSLTYRPLVLTGTTTVCIHAANVNAGSSMIVDGQVPINLGRDAVIELTCAGADFMLVHNQQYSHWRILQKKLNWGTGPNYKKAST